MSARKKATFYPIEETRERWERFSREVDRAAAEVVHDQKVRERIGRAVMAHAKRAMRDRK